MTPIRRRLSTISDCRIRYAKSGVRRERIEGEDPTGVLDEETIEHVVVQTKAFEQGDDMTKDVIVAPTAEPMEPRLCAHVVREKNSVAVSILRKLDHDLCDFVVAWRVATLHQE